MSNESDAASADPAADQPAARPATPSADLPAAQPATPATDQRDARPADQHATGIAHRLANQWSQMRNENRGAPAPIAAGPSNFSRAQVPWSVDLAASWAWRVLIIGFAVYVLARIFGYFSVVTLPIVIALLIAALVSPVVAGLTRLGLPQAVASILVVLGLIGFLTVLLTFAGQQVANGATDLADQTVAGLGEIRDWLRNGPLNASDSQINAYIESIQTSISAQSENGKILGAVTEFGTALGHVLAGFFIILFSTYFFLADGSRIWSWLVRLSPRAARHHVDSSGRVAWISLTQFVRATVIVAAVDAIGIMIVAAILGVPFVAAIGVLVFIGAFIPLVGATVAGVVAILVALVDQGPITALFMLGGVVLVQQIEGHILQPFLMGRWVSVHPLGVIVALACGVIVAGIPGALIAVPFAAAVNAVIQHLAANTAPGDDAAESLQQDYEEIGASVDVERRENVVE